jgi:hypothetical protein
MRNVDTAQQKCGHVDVHIRIFALWSRAYTRVNHLYLYLLVRGMFLQRRCQKWRPKVRATCPHVHLLSSFSEGSERTPECLTTTALTAATSPKTADATTTTAPTAAMRSKKTARRSHAPALSGSSAASATVGCHDPPRKGHRRPIPRTSPHRCGLRRTRSARSAQIALRQPVHGEDRWAS